MDYKGFVSNYNNGFKAKELLNGFVGNINRHYYQEEYESIKENNKDNWNGIGWRGDCLNSEIVLYTEEIEVNNVKVYASDFINENGAIINKDNVNINFIKYVSGHVGRGDIWGIIPNNTVPRVMIPDILDNVSSVDLKNKTVQPVWIQLYVPKNTVAGTYKGNIIIEYNNEESRVFNYEVEVLDLIQPHINEQEFYFELWQYPYSVARYYDVIPFSDKHFEILRPHLEMYGQCGGKAITATIIEDPWNHQTFDTYPSMIKWTRTINGEYTFDFSIFDKWINFNMSLGIDKRINCFSIVPWENRIIFFDEEKKDNIEEILEPGSKEWSKAWNLFIKEFINHIDDKGWFDITYIAMDERPMDIMIPALDLIESIRNKDGKSLKIAGAMNYNALDNNILDRIQDISINLAYVNHESNTLRDLAQYRKNLGLNTTLYTCVGNYPSSFARSNPSESAWTIWYTASQRVNGFLRWAYDAWIEEPLESIDHWYWESGDAFFIYPGNKNDEIPVPRSTPRFERLKEGIRDIEKINYLRKITPNFKYKLDELLDSVDRVYGKVNKWGANEAGSNENKHFIDNEVERLRETLMNISKEVVKEKNKS